jgi:NodT family efflux transporter outer membrane factor (OMF) lipoprotein
MKTRRILLAVAVGLDVAGCVTLTGCVTPPKDLSPQSSLHESDVGLAGEAVAPAPEGWWRSFDDPQLNRLVDDALRDSPNLAEARARLRDAVAQADAAHAGLFPRANLDASVQRLHAPQNYFIPPPLAGEPTWVGQVGATLSWDLDFWGRQADGVARARDLAQASNLDIDHARLLLAGAIAQAYVDLYRAYALADIAARAEAQRLHIVEITQRRVAAGLDTRLELREAESQLPQARVARAQALAAAELAVHQLATLSGHGSEAYAAMKQPTLNLDAALPLPKDLPINLLVRRPDVLAARLQVQAADSQRLAAKAAFYPDVSLSAVAGFGAFGLNNLFSWSARGAGGGPMISLPLFDAGRLRAQYRGSEAELDAAVAAYNATVLEAVQQTADQLTRIDALARERVDQQRALDAAEDAYRIGEKRYQAGLSGYLSVLNVETQVLAARRDFVGILADQATARVSLLLAVGGSFDPALHADRSSDTRSGTSGSIVTGKAAP